MNSNGMLANGMITIAMQPDPTLVLRDIHQPPAPPWWPPAPGWWLVAALVLLACAVAYWFAGRRRHRLRALAQLFDDSVAAQTHPSAKIAAMSELLRRAARRRHPDADRLRGEDWFRFLDRGLKVPVFASEFCSILQEGAFRRDVTLQQADALRPHARARFMQWMAMR